MKTGFLVGRENDWIYIDWADMDKTGALCAEQMLFAACWQTMAKVSAALGEENPEYMEKYEKLIGQIRKLYWDQEKGAFIDSFESGKRNGPVMPIFLQFFSHCNTRRAGENSGKCN